MFYVFIVLTVGATSLLSGILGMAGGMILMAVLVTTMGVASAMLLHGAVQATANGSRAWFLRQHIRWSILPVYTLGALLATGVFAAITLVPHPGLVLMLVGLFPWLARFSKRLSGLNVTRPLTTLVCGVVVTSAQLLAGASGPLLDVFYLNSPLTRQEIVANKALTQTLGHILKMIYYGLIISVATTIPPLLLTAALIMAIVGTRLGTWLLHRWNDRDFQKISQLIILSIATLCLLQGGRMLLLDYL
ncbi:MAG: sulfite exporter TauE/SafE family protein [Pseudomonadales bacterium]